VLTFTRFWLSSLCVFTLASARADWTFLLEAADGSAYMDTSTIKKNGDLVSAWFLREMKQPTPSPMHSDRLYRSSKLQIEVDCKRHNYRVLYSAWHEGLKASGRIVSELNNVKTGSLNWQLIPPQGSFILPLVVYVCQ
jgi:hypothetical protein